MVTGAGWLLKCQGITKKDKTALYDGLRDHAGKSGFGTPLETDLRPGDGKKSQEAERVQGVKCRITSFWPGSAVQIHQAANQSQETGGKAGNRKVCVWPENTKSAPQSHERRFF